MSITGVRRALVIGAAGLAGCDLVFHLDDAPPCAAELAGHDEDSDGLDDACDPCPHLSSDIDVRDDDDGDGDRVGDGCDPRPDVAGDRIVRFDTFELTADRTVLGDQDRIVLAGEFPNARLTTRIAVDVLTTVGAHHELGLAAGVGSESAPRPDGLWCHLGRSDIALADYMDTMKFDDGIGAADQHMSEDLRGFARLEATVTLDTTPDHRIRCDVTDDAGLLASIESVATFEPGALALFVQGARVELAYVVVITRDD